jgi:predicted amidohydrolase YtcJ
MSASSWLIRGAMLPGRGMSDLRIDGAYITGIARQLKRVPGEAVVEAGGHSLIRGLHDHHIHLFATAAARASLQCGPPEVRDEQGLRQAIASCPGAAGDWIRGVGFHESVCERLDRHWLDAVCPERPVRIQHRSGMLWVLNSCAITQLRLAGGEPLPPGAGIDVNGEPDGRFLGLDQWLGERIPQSWPSLGELSTQLARFGVTGVTDAGVGNGRSVWNALQEACTRGELVQRLLVMGNEELNGLVATGPARIEVGPLKIYLRETQFPDLESLVRRMRAARTHGRAIAVHCVTRAELAFAIAAFDEAGSVSGDRIEHAAIADDEAIRELARLGITVVTQPQFIAERGTQYLADVDREDHELLYRGAGFLRQGVALAAGSDAPYGGVDPWSAMRAAIARRTCEGVLIGACEALELQQAFMLFSGDPGLPGSTVRGPAVGDVADLCLLDLPRLANVADLHARHVRLTVCAGRIVHDSGGFSAR